MRFQSSAKKYRDGQNGRHDPGETDFGRLIIIWFLCGKDSVSRQPKFESDLRVSPDGIEPLAAWPREGEDLLTLAQEAGGLGIFEWQVQTGLMRLSPKLQTLYGMTDFDGRHETWLTYVFREDVVRVTNAIEEAFRAQAANIVQEFRIVPPNERAPRWMETRALAIYDEEGRPEWLVGVSVDVTIRKRALVQLRAFAETLEDRVKARTRELEAENEARRKAEESLRQAQKMEVVGQLTGGLAHDFNNLLTIVMGGLHIIENQMALLPESPVTIRIARARRMALEGADRAANLTERLLAFARRQPLAPRPIDPGMLISGIVDLLRRTIGEAIILMINATDETWDIHADSNQLENALLNLAVNARDAMPNGGTITISTKNIEFGATDVTALAEPVEPGQYVMIAIADSGTGMAPATMEHIFEPFFTTKDVGKGTGLGLSQVYGFVRQSSGHVRVESEVGHGTTVTIYLPRHIGRDKPAGVARGQRAAGHAAATECILVVEDDDALRAYVTEALRDFGYRILEARNGAAALLVLEGRPDIDLLLTDIVMPGGMNGRELADAARTGGPGLKVLFMTGYSGDAIEDHRRLDPDMRLIGKPFSIDGLARKVRGVLDEVDNR
jgi:signal transduction histidine kinase